MQNTYQEKILDLENTNNSINKKLEEVLNLKLKVIFNLLETSLKLSKN